MFDRRTRARIARPCTLLMAILSSAVAQAQPLTFEEALDEAANNAPSIEARSAQADAARSAAISAPQLPDPKIEVGVQDFPVTGPNAGRFNRDNFTMTKIGVSQAFPNPAKRQARRARAIADIGAAEAAEQVEARNVRVATATAWIDLHFAERRLAILKLLDDSVDDIAATVSARLTSGSARPSQALEPKQIKAEIGDRRAGIVAEIAKARAALTRWTGIGQPEATGPSPDWAVDPATLRAGIDALPSLRALDAATVQAEADVRLARADKRPDWEVRASYGRRDPNFGDLASVGVSIDLPLFSKHRQNPLIAARTKDVDRARLDRAAATREAMATLDTDLAEHAMHHDRYLRARDVLVPLARQRAELDRVGYAAGTVDLGTALGTTFASALAEIDALDREAGLARDVVRIDLTYGDDQ